MHAIIDFRLCLVLIWMGALCKVFVFLGDCPMRLIAYKRVRSWGQIGLSRAASYFLAWMARQLSRAVKRFSAHCLADAQARRSSRHRLHRQLQRSVGDWRSLAYSLMQWLRTTLIYKHRSHLLNTKAMELSRYITGAVADPKHSHASRGRSQDDSAAGERQHRAKKMNTFASF